MTPVIAKSIAGEPSPDFCLLLLNLRCSPSPLCIQYFIYQKQLSYLLHILLFLCFMHAQHLTLLGFMTYTKPHPLRLKLSSFGINWQRGRRNYIKSAGKEGYHTTFETFLSYKAAEYETFMSIRPYSLFFLLVSSLLVGVVYSKKTYGHPHDHFSESEASKPLAALITSAGTWVRVQR